MIKQTIKKNKGGAIGTIAGAVLGTAIPGVGNAVGASVGGAAGNLIGSLFGRTREEKEPEPPATIGRTFTASYGFRTGGGIPSVDIAGRSHEAGGVSLSELGRPDVEVERGESVLLNEMGEPIYAFSAIRMNDSPRTFAEEFQRLREKGDLDGIKKLQKKQEQQMDRKKNVTMTESDRAMIFSKYGGNLTTKENPVTLRKGSHRYGGHTTRKGFQLGGAVPPYYTPSGTNTYQDPELDVISTSLYSAPSIPDIKVAPEPASLNVAKVNVPSVSRASRDEYLNTLTPAESGNVGNAGNTLSTLGKVLPYMSDIFNIGVASRIKDPKRPRTVTPYLMDSRVSTTADEEALTTSFRAVLADPAASSAQKQAALAGLARAKSQIRSQANQRSEDIQRGNIQLLNRSQELNAAANERYEERVDQTRGARLSAISEGVSSLAGRFEREAFAREARDMEPLQIASLLHSLPTQRRREFIQDLLNSLPPGHRLIPTLTSLSGG